MPQRMHFSVVPLLFLAPGLVTTAGGQVPPDVAAIESRYRQRADQNIEMYRKGDATITFQTSDGRPARSAHITIDQQTHDFLFGNLVFELAGQGRRTLDPQERQLFEKRFLDVFNFAVLPFYWRSYEQEPGKPRWKDFEPVIEWCQSNGVTLKGHPLSWGATAPMWLEKLPEQTYDCLLSARILNNTAGFAGKVDIWDVVNEPLTEPPFGTIGGKQWPQELPAVAGTIDKAFRMAHAGNPNATLILNEYDIVSNIWSNQVQLPRRTKPSTAKHIGTDPPREEFLRLIAELDRRGTPKFDVGLQAHEPEFDWLKPEDFWDACDAIAKAGHQVHITELLFPANGRPITGGWRTGNWTREAQAEYAEQRYRLAFGHPAVVSINYWGLSDRAIWRDEGGMVDRDYNPKPIYNRVKGLIKEEWMTHGLDLITDEAGLVRFRGFYGKYRVSVRTTGGREQSFSLHLSKGGQTRWEFHLATE